MSLPRRHWLIGSAAIAASLPALSWGASPIRLLVGFPPGGGTDAIARLLADKLKDRLGAPVVVENRPGAGGQIAARALKAAPADGTTLFLTHDHTISILPQVVKNPGFAPDEDFVPVAGIASFVNGFALAGGTPARSFTGYVEWLRKQHGGKGAVGIPAPASTPEFLVQLLARRYQLDLVAAPYRGGAPLLADMMGNQIAAGIGSVQDFIEHHILDLVEHRVLGLDVVQQTARRGHQHLDALFQLNGLRLHVHAAKNHGAAQLGVFGVQRNLLGHLVGQLTRGQQHQGAHGVTGGRCGTALVLEQALQQGQRERRGLAGAGLGSAHDVLPCEDHGNGLLLDGRHGLVAHFGHGACQRLGQR